MYCEHFGLSGAPFEFNPSASVLFMSAGHREGLAALQWGLREPSGFTMLVGEIGAGKTTLIYSLLATRHQGVRSAWVANPRLSFEEILRQILGQLGVEQSVTSGKLELLQTFDALLASLPADECVAVVIDEAQDLSDEALEDLRLLSNFQSLERRRLQIVLVGQIELARRLAGPQLRQLNQRIGARALLPTLRGSEIYDYVEYRIRSCNGDIDHLFTRRAIKELARESGGIPRRINVLCHNALLLAYAEGAARVTDQHVQDATRDYDHLLVSRVSAREKIAASATGALAAICLLAIVAAGFLELRPSHNHTSTMPARFTAQDKEPRPQVQAEWSPAQFTTRSQKAPTPAPKTIVSAPINVHDGSAGSANELIWRGSPDGSSTNQPAAPEKPKPEIGASSDSTVIVGVGDTLSTIAKRLYGSFGTDTLSRLTAANPEIKDANLIYPGQSIRVQQTTK